MQITVEYTTGQSQVFDLLPDVVSNNTMIAVFMSGAQIARAFSIVELRAICTQLKLPKPKTKALAVAAIVKLTGNPSA